MGVVEEVSYQHRGKGVYSQYLLVPKKSHGLYPTVELRKLNCLVKEIKFRMVTLISTIPSLKMGNCMLLSVYRMHTSMWPYILALGSTFNSLLVHSPSLQTVISTQGRQHVCDSSNNLISTIWTFKYFLTWVIS